jgi:hypothetical protein
MHAAEQLLSQLTLVDAEMPSVCHAVQVKAMQQGDATIQVGTLLA